MFSLPRLTATLTLASLVVAAPLPDTAPTCVTNCFQQKLAEADTLAPGVGASNIAGLCANAQFVAAYNTCLSDHCDSEDLQTGQSLGSQVCAAASTAASFSSGAASTLSSLSSSLSSALSSVSSDVLSRVSTATASIDSDFDSASIASATSLNASSLSSQVGVASITSSLSSRIASATDITSTSSPSATGDGSNAASSIAAPTVLAFTALLLALLA
ncbi:hypothetical protein JCM10207_002603 [Rhodosporidiobolus poonsookiae]